MPARPAAKQKAKTLPFNLRLPKEPIVDLAYTAQQTKVEVRTGSLANGVTAGIELIQENGGSGMVHIYWTLERQAAVNGELQITDPYPDGHTDIEFESDEIEAIATALFEAVQLAKKAGYLPAVTLTEGPARKTAREAR